MGDEMVELTPEEVRKWADTVQFGECITFPNGLTVDKRWIQPLTQIPSVWSPPGPGYPGSLPQQWQRRG